jgi:hypothetical protein
MGHPGPGAMRKHETRARLRGLDQKRGDGVRIPDPDLQLLGADDVHLI